jgi:hypothetical protein
VVNSSEPQEAQNSQNCSFIDGSIIRVEISISVILKILWFLSFLWLNFIVVGLSIFGVF